MKLLLVLQAEHTLDAAPAAAPRVFYHTLVYAHGPQ